MSQSCLSVCSLLAGSSGIRRAIDGYGCRAPLAAAALPARMTGGSWPSIFEHFCGGVECSMLRRHENRRDLSDAAEDLAHPRVETVGLALATLGAVLAFTANARKLHTQSRAPADACARRRGHGGGSQAGGRTVDNGGLTRGRGACDQVWATRHLAATAEGPANPARVRRR